MAAPATEELREISRLLTIAGETGGTVSFAALQEEVGLGHDDLRDALGTLAQHGQAEELAPGEWTAPDPSYAREQRVTVSVPDELEEEDPEPPRRAQLVTAGGDTTVRLTRSIADALGEEALGQIVKAGLAGVGELDAFTLEVLP